MEVKFASILNDLGVSVEQTTTKIRDLKNVFDEAWQQYSEMLEDYKACTDVQEKEVLMEEINEFEADLQAADNELVKKIDEWVKNKDKWEENKRKMAEGRARKAAQSAAPASEPNPEPTPAANIQNVPLQGSATMTQVGQPTFVAADGGEVKEEESSGSGWWILAGFVAVVTLGAVVMKRR